MTKFLFSKKIKKLIFYLEEIFIYEKTDPYYEEDNYQKGDEKGYITTAPTNFKWTIGSIMKTGCQ